MVKLLYSYKLTDRIVIIFGQWIIIKLKVAIKSHRGFWLEDRDGAVGLADHAESWQHWTLKQANGGKYFVVSHRGQKLEVRDDHVSLHDDALGWQEWEIQNPEGLPPCGVEGADMAAMAASQMADDDRKANEAAVAESGDTSAYAQLWYVSGGI